MSQINVRLANYLINAGSLSATNVNAKTAAGGLSADVSMFGQFNIPDIIVEVRSAQNGGVVLTSLDLSNYSIFYFHLKPSGTLGTKMATVFNMTTASNYRFFQNANPTVSGLKNFTITWTRMTEFIYKMTVTNSPTNVTDELSIIFPATDSLKMFQFGTTSVTFLSCAYNLIGKIK